MLAELRTRLGSELEGLAHQLAAGMEADSALSRGAIADETCMETQRDLQERIRRLGQLVAGLVCVDPSTIWSDRAGYGSIVRIRDRASGTEETYTLMTGDLIDLDEGQVSLASPVGNALLGRRAGEEIAVVTPRGERRYKILDVVTLPDKLGIAHDRGDPAGVTDRRKVA